MLINDGSYNVNNYHGADHIFLSTEPQKIWQVYVVNLSCPLDIKRTLLVSNTVSKTVNIYIIYNKLM